MATIEVIDEKIIVKNIIGNDPEKFLEFSNLTDVFSFIENFKAKFERFSKGCIGFEHRTWVGFYTTCPDEMKEPATKIMEKYKDRALGELKILEDTNDLKPDKKKKIIIK